MKKKLTLLLVVCLTGISTIAQQGNVRVTDYGNFSVDYPHFVINGNEVDLTFATNLSYMNFPVEGPSVLFPLVGSQITVPNWGPFYAEVGNSGTNKLVAFLDFVSSGSTFNVFLTYSQDTGNTWVTPFMVQQVGTGTSIPSNHYNPSLKSVNGDVYVLLQSYSSPDSGIVSVYKASPPGFNPNFLFQPYALSNNIFPEDLNYSAGAAGGNTNHLISYFDNQKMYFQKSTDDGLSHTPPTVIWDGNSPDIVFQNVEGTDMDFDATGRVAIVWSVHGENTGFQIFDKTYLAYSVDFGNTFTVDTLPGIYAFNPALNLKSDGQQVITYKNNGNIFTVTTDHLLATTAPVLITDTATTGDFHTEMFNGNFLCAAWEDSRFGFGYEEIYYDTLFVPSATIPPSGINNSIVQQEEVFVFPNPFSEEIFISGKQEILSAEITDLAGRKIYSNCGLSRIEFPGLASGLYFLKVNMKAGTKTFKVIKR